MNFACTGHHQLRAPIGSDECCLHADRVETFAILLASNLMNCLESCWLSKVLYKTGQRPGSGLEYQSWRLLACFGIMHCVCSGEKMVAANESLRLALSNMRRTVKCAIYICQVAKSVHQVHCVTIVSQLTAHYCHHFYSFIRFIPLKHTLSN